VVGCLELSGKAGGFTERDVRIADAFAQIAAIALRNSHDRQELAYAEERFRNVVQTATDAVISIDHDRNIVLWNPSAERIFGYSNEEILGWTVDILVPARLRHVHTAAIARRLQAGAATLPARMIEVVAVHKDGREIPAELSLASWRSSEGDFFTAIVRDISERKGAQETERKLQERIQQAERLEAFGRIAAGVAHDFNNLLGVILGNAELALLRTLPGNSIHDELSEIAKTVHRSADITRQLLAFARRQPIQPQRVDLNATLSAMTNVLRHLAGDRIELVLRLEPALWPVRMDPSQVDQLVTNLVVNARDAIGGTGIIVLETANHRVTSSQLVGVTELAAGAYVRLSVSDDGSGMDAKTIERIFEPFFTTKVVGRGTGLGLATVYGIARQNGGGIAVHSEVGRGSRFEVHLPRCDGDRPEQLESTSCQATTASAAVGAHTILVVEDHPALLKLSTGILEGHGYAVVPTSSPTEAVRFASEHPGPIDLVLIDMLLPDMNGSDLALRIRQFRPNIRCLFTSGYAADISSGETLADGTAFLQKPVSAAALAQGVHSLLAGQPTT
jgi:PAS domain S-box-containing protein